VRSVTVTSMMFMMPMPPTSREIGIRKAIGAERSSIITQFLIEAAVICGAPWAEAALRALDPTVQITWPRLMWPAPWPKT
jgi:hypothetical protein